jgi:hypothetical protein
MAEPPEANGADTARPIQVTPAGGAPLPPDSVLPVTLPNSATLEFNASGQVKGFQYSAGAQLQWQHDGQYYQARQSISMFLLERAQTSEGLITPKGLQPLNFSDKGAKPSPPPLTWPAARRTTAAARPMRPSAMECRTASACFCSSRP